ncbi:MAG: hypothetical protein Kow0098_14460 [Ignavibacteriaceae bacterium]
MKKIFLIIIFLAVGLPLRAQIYETGWGLGFGLTYPRFFSVTSTGYSGNDNFGGYLSVERNFSEHVALRIHGDFLHMESVYYDLNENEQTQKVNQVAANADILYKFVPCEPVTPYFMFGLGISVFSSQNSFSEFVDDNVVGYQGNIGLGTDWKLSEDWFLRTEAVYRTASNNKLDGNERINENDKGLFGGNGDTYMTFEAGMLWFFSWGEPSDLCEKCPEGVREIIKEVPVIKEVPKEIIKEIRDTVFVKDFELFGINFEFDKAEIRPESYPILERAVNILKANPDIEVLISGHTDSFGADDYNLRLSERRVNVVYDYLVNNGIDSSRITKSAYGESNPIRNNDSAINRAFNRRVEFKVTEK